VLVGMSLTEAGLGIGLSASTEPAGVCCARRQLMRIGIRRTAMVHGAMQTGCPIQKNSSLASAAPAMLGAVGAGFKTLAEAGVALLSLAAGGSVSGDGGTASGVAALMMAEGLEPCTQQMQGPAFVTGLVAEGVGTTS